VQDPISREMRRFMAHTKGSAVPKLAPITSDVRLAGKSGVVRPKGAGGAPGAGGAAKFVDNGGAVIEIARVQLIFWGNAWASNPAPNPTSEEVTDSLVTVMRGPYMTGLAQYRQIGRGYLLGSTVYSNSNPPNPFQDSDVSNFISARIADGTIPPLDPDKQNLYLVVMPQGVNNTNSGFIGEHTYFTDGSGNRIHFGWITNGGDLNGLMSVLTHELVESVTDPEGSAILGTSGTCSQGGWCEIGDVCYVDSVIDGVTVQKYYSDNDTGCIAPTFPALTFPISGVQWRGTMPPNAVITWFTYDWPEYYFVEWDVMPVTPRPGAPEIKSRVAVERASGAYITYWIAVTNLTNSPVDIEGRFVILGRSE
jgi:hypothetical protein